MKLYPLVFSFRDLIAGTGFVAAVSMDGHVLLSEEDDTWMFGVQPGGIAGGGPDRPTAFKEFKNSYLSVLFDIAAEATSFDEFERRTRAFFAQVNEPNRKQWDDALAEVRKTSTCLPGVKTVQAEANPPTLAIEKVVPERVKPNVNEFDQITEAA